MLVWIKWIKSYLTNLLIASSLLNPIQDGHFRGCSWMEGSKKAPLPKICHTYPTMIKLGTVVPYLKKIQKIYESRDTPADFCWHQHFPTRNQQIVLYQEIQIWIAYWFIISNSFSFNWVFKDFFNKRVIILMMSAKIATPGFLKITLFWNKSYDVIISVDDVTSKVLSRDSNYIRDAFMRPKFDNCSISMREVITTSIL